jgi:hypothetical protein
MTPMVQLPLEEFNALLQIAARLPYGEVYTVLDAVRAKVKPVEDPVTAETPEAP